MSNLNLCTVSVELAALGTAKTRGFRAPFDGRILSVSLGFHAAVDDNNVVQVEIDEVDVTGGGVTLTAALSAVGKTYVLHPTALNEFRQGQYISIDTDGGGTVGDLLAVFALEQK